jgi:hypothetical protein
MQTNALGWDLPADRYPAPRNFSRPDGGVEGLYLITTYVYSLYDGEPMRPGMTGVGSDVDTGNAEICSVTADSSNVFR